MKTRVVEKPLNGEWRWIVEIKYGWWCGWKWYHQYSKREDAIYIAEGLMKEKVVWSSDNTGVDHK